MSSMPVAAWILAKASSYDCTFSIEAWMDALSFAMPQLPRSTFFLSDCSCSTVMSPRCSC